MRLKGRCDQNGLCLNHQSLCGIDNEVYLWVSQETFIETQGTKRDLAIRKEISSFGCSIVIDYRRVLLCKREKQVVTKIRFSNSRGPINDWGVVGISKKGMCLFLINQPEQYFVTSTNKQLARERGAREARKIKDFAVRVDNKRLKRAPTRSQSWVDCFCACRLTSAT